MKKNYTKAGVLQTIANTVYCTESCEFSEFCPRLLDSMMSKSKECLIRLNYKTEFDKFYNLFFAENDGLKNEMRTTAYRLGLDAVTADDELTYFNSLQKMSTTFYAPEKSSKDDTVSSVNIFYDKK